MQIQCVGWGGIDSFQSWSYGIWKMWLYVHYRKERRTLFLKLSLCACVCMYVCDSFVYDRSLSVNVWVSLLVHMCVPIYVEIRGQSQEYILTFHLCFRQGLVFSAAYSRLSEPWASEDPPVYVHLIHQKSMVIGACYNSCPALHVIWAPVSCLHMCTSRTLCDVHLPGSSCESS